MQTPWTVDVLPYIGEDEDEYGNTADAWATTPVTQPVYGWGPPGNAGTGTFEYQVGRDTVTVDLQVYAPSDFTAEPKDRVVVLGKTYEVQGEVEDFDHGPFGFAPGVRVNLRRAS